jgi:acyl-CoA thioesterase
MNELAQLAERVARTLHARDAVCSGPLGIEMLSCTPGRATTRMTVGQQHLNSHGTCHGGLVFTLADAAFSFACNSHNQVAVAAACSIEFLRPSREGDVLTCEGQEQVLSGRHGIYDMRVSNQRGEVVALFRGKSAQVGGTHLSPAATS